MPDFGDLTAVPLHKCNNLASGPTPRRRRSTFSLALILAAVMAVGGAAGVIRAANERTSDVERIAGLDEILQPKDGPALNYLLIGSDTREGSDPNSPDFGGIGDTNARCRDDAATRS